MKVGLVSDTHDNRDVIEDAVELFTERVETVVHCGEHIAVYHGTSDPIVDAFTNCKEYDYVFHRHTHEHAHEEHGGTPTKPDGEPPAAVVLDTDTGEVTFHDLG